MISAEQRLDTGEAPAAHVHLRLKGHFQLRQDRRLAQRLLEESAAMHFAV